MTTAILTQARATWLGLVFVSPLLLWKFKKLRKPALAGALAIIALMLLYPQNPISRRLQPFKGHTKTFSTQNRIAQWKANLELSAHHPILGVGYAANRKDEVIGPYLRGFKHKSGSLQYQHPHSEYVDVLVGMGGVSLLLFLMLSAFSPLKTLKAFRSTSRLNPFQSDALTISLSFQAFIFSTAMLDKITSIEWSAILCSWGLTFFILLQTEPKNKKSNP